jgi:hypothetical protein
MTTFRAPRRLLSVLAVAAVVGAACSSSSPQPAPSDRPQDGGQSVEPLAVIAAAADRIDAADALAMDFTMTMSIGGQALSGSGSAVGASDGSRMRMQMRYDAFPGLPEGFEMEMILADGVMYMATSTLAAMGAPSGAFDGKDWVSIDLDAVAPAYESLADLGTGPNDPSQSFAYLQGASDVELVGTEDLDGETTTHFRGTLDLERALAELPADARAELREAMQQLQTQFSADSMPFDVWVDGDGLIRRMSYRIEGSAEQAFSLEMTMDITDYDADLDFDVPAPGDVVDVSDLAGGV